MKEDKKDKTKMTKRKKTILIIVSSVVGVALLTGFAAAFRSQAARIQNRRQQQPQTIELKRTDITNTISVSGVVNSANTTNIYSTQSYPVKTIYAEVGDAVKVGDVLAELDMSKLEKDIEQAEINYESSLISEAEEERSNKNSIANAKLSLEAAQISLARQQLNTENAEKSLLEAQENFDEPFDSYNYDLTIEDSRISLERKTAELKTAEDDLEEALKNFDDYTYKNAITEASVTLERKRIDVENAEKDLAKEKAGTADGFDDTTYQRKVDDAKKVRDEKFNDYLKNTSDTALLQAWQDAEEALRRAIEDQSKAWDDHVSKYNDSVAAAEKALTNARNSFDDAQRSYNKALTDLERAKNDAASSASDNLEKAQNAVADAKRAYEKALNDKERAIDNYIKDNESKLDSEKRSYADSQKQLQSSQNSVKSAQNTLNQAQSKPETADSNVRLQELNLEKLNTQLAEGKIIATANGVITEAYAKVGATPSGIMFVIESVDDLYVSAKIKEYNLSSIALGQDTMVTTDATGDAVYEAKVVYISPKAVSEAGSTSVEFEVRAALADPGDNVKIGMNAFLNIVTDMREDVYAVPISSLVTDERGSFIYTPNEENGVNEIPVTIGIKTSTNAEIISDGLYDGLKLLVDPEQKLNQNSGGMSFPFGRGS